MRARGLLLAVPLVLLLAGCGGGTGNKAGSSPSPTAPGATCTPTGTGTKDLATKPVVPSPRPPAPTETTTYDIVCGTGKEAKSGDDVEVKYVGVLHSNGTEFDSSWSRGATDTLKFQIGGNVIPGFSKGVEGMREGGRRMIVIPAKDGYGESGTGPIPPNATLIFVVDLVKVG